MQNKDQDILDRTAQLFDNLVVATWNKSSIDVLYTIVRVSGMSDPGWDPFDTAINSFAEYRELIALAEKEENKLRVLRFKLLNYCHLIECSAPLEILYNLFRIRADQPFHVRPFVELNRSKKSSFKVVPPSVNQKIKELEKMVTHPEDKELLGIYKSIFNDDIRNSFFHSDYCLTEDEYRWTESGPAQSMKIEVLEQLIHNAFAFFRALFHVWDQSRYHLGASQTFWKLPNFETLELLRNPKGMLNGFSMHFSNGHVATFCRNLDGSLTANNLTFENDGSVNFFVGPIYELKKYWCIRGNEVKDWNAINKQ